MRTLHPVWLTLLALPLGCGGPDSTAPETQSTDGIEISAETLSALDRGGRLELRLGELPAGGVQFDTTKGFIDFSQIYVVDGEQPISTMSRWLTELRDRTGVELRHQEYFGLEPGPEPSSSGVGTETRGLSQSSAQPNLVVPNGIGWYDCAAAPSCFSYRSWHRTFVVCHCPLDRQPDFHGPAEPTFVDNPNALPPFHDDGPTGPEPNQGSTGSSGGSGGSSSSGSSGSSGGGASGSGSIAGSGGSQSAGGGASGGGNAGGW